MSKQKNNEVIRKNELGYLQTGDYFIPDLKLPQENRSIGKYGRMHRDYLQEHNPIRFDDLVLEGKLWTYLADLNEQAKNRLQLIIKQMQEAGIDRREKTYFATGEEYWKQLSSAFKDYTTEKEEVKKALGRGGIGMALQYYDLKISGQI